MIKVFFAAILFLISPHLFGQNQIMIFQKRNELIHTYSTGSYVAFMDVNRQWQYGIITKIRNDSFDIKLYSVQYNAMTIDTIHFGIASFSLADVYAMPKAGIEIDDGTGPRNHQIAMDAGHVHFYWIKGGWLFRTLGIGYAALNLFNGLVIKNQPVNWAGLGIAAGVFAVGEFLKLNYRPYVKLGKKYFLIVH